MTTSHYDLIDHDSKLNKTTLHGQKGTNRLQHLQKIGGSVVKPACRQAGEALCFVSSVVMADRFVLRNRQLLVAEKR